MMPAEGMGPHADAKQRVELSKEGVGPTGEPKPKVSLFGFLLTNYSSCLAMAFFSEHTQTDARVPSLT